MPRTRLVCAAGIAIALVTSCSSADSGPNRATGGPATPSSLPATDTAPHSPRAGLPRPAHVVVAIFENEDATDVVGAPEAPYLTELAGSGASFDDAHGETHPSQPNYLALFSG